MSRVVLRMRISPTPCCPPYCLPDGVHQRGVGGGAGQGEEGRQQQGHVGTRGRQGGHQPRHLGRHGGAGGGGGAGTLAAHSAPLVLQLGQETEHVCLYILTAQIFRYYQSPQPHLARSGAVRWYIESILSLARSRVSPAPHSTPRYAGYSDNTSGKYFTSLKKYQVVLAPRTAASWRTPGGRICRRRVWAPTRGPRGRSAARLQA